MQAPGLTRDDAARRLARDGPNLLVPKKPFEGLRHWLGLIADPMVALLGAAAVIDFLIGRRLDAWVLIASLVPVLLIDLLLHTRAKLALREAAARVRPRTRVRRDSQTTWIPVEDVVCGDLLLVEEGDIIPADAEVVGGHDLSVDESSITGEAEPAEKSLEPAHADARRLFAGTSVLAGAGEAVVLATGGRTEYGKIGALLAGTPEQRSPLQRQIGRLTLQLGVAAVALCALVFGVSFLQTRDWAQALLAAVSLAIAAMPEEFPTVYTVYLTLGVWALSKQRALVRRLASVETLGSTTVICSDKTGTLTEGLLDVQAALPLGAATIDDVWLAAVRASEITPVDILERRILDAAAPFVPAELRTRGSLRRDFQFDPTIRLMSHVWETPDGRLTLFVKGAPEALIARASLDEAGRASAQAEADRLAAEGMRVIAVADRAIGDASRTRAELEQELRLIGLIGFADRPRPEVAVAIRECHDAGVRVVMITGDHLLTAHAIAHAIGLPHSDDQVALGADLVALEDAALTARMRRIAIVARALPAQKYALVQALRRGGAIVAMTGDGVNDAPALRASDIGVAMGKRGTEVARAAADIVLLDDDFGTIVAAVRMGRGIGDNLRAAFRYLIAFHLPIIWLALLVPLLNWPILLLPVTILWLELLIHPTVALVFQARLPAANLMHRPPRDPAAPLLDRRETIDSVSSGTAIAFVTLALYGLELSAGTPAAQARAIATTALILSDIVLTGAILSEVGLAGLARNAFFWGTTAMALGLLAVAIYLPPAARVTGLAPLSLHAWLEALGGAALSALLSIVLRRWGVRKPAHL